MNFSLTPDDLLVLWQSLIIGITWIVAVIYLFSGVQDLMYDLWAYAWRVYRRFRFAKNTRLTLSRLRLKEQQTIAVYIPAWQEADVVDKMVENILHRAEYQHYVIFVGTYPNDAATQRAVDIIAAAHDRVIKVVTTRPGPTNKADCLNHIYLAMQAYEQAHQMIFDIVVMHDAEDVIHPYSFMLYNYLLPRVDVVQLPILPLPVPWNQWVHWVYGDEFAENHMKDMIVRERQKGFVPFAGVGTGFSRHSFSVLAEMGGGKVFNEYSLTEDYSTSKKVREAGLQTIFVNLLLADDRSPWYTPLCRRPGFISNWSYFPFDFARSVRQKTRWVIGISLQEWEQTGWSGTWMMRENLLKDRKVFVSSATVLVGYLVVLYFLIYQLGQWNLVPFKWLPIISRGTALYDLIVVVTGFMIVRMLQRFIMVTMVYGPLTGLLAFPRLFLGNVVNGLSAFLALKTYLETWQGRAMAWDKTDHQEGVGALPAVAEALLPPRKTLDFADFVNVLRSSDVWEIISVLNALDPDSGDAHRAEVFQLVRVFGRHEDHHIRAVTGRVIGNLGWAELLPFARELLFDSDWVVRANAATALARSPHVLGHLPLIFQRSDRYAWEIFIRSIEQYDPARELILTHLQEGPLAAFREMILAQSPNLAKQYAEMTMTTPPADGWVLPDAPAPAEPVFVADALPIEHYYTPMPAGEEQPYVEPLLAELPLMPNLLAAEKSLASEPPRAAEVPPAAAAIPESTVPPVTAAIAESPAPPADVSSGRYLPPPVTAPAAPAPVLSEAPAPAEPEPEPVAAAPILEKRTLPAPSFASIPLQIRRSWQPSDWLACNAFRVLGLPSTAVRNEIHDNAAVLLTVSRATIDASTPWDFPYLGPVNRTGEEVGKAVAYLDNPIYRLIDRVFWFHQGADTLAKLTDVSLPIIAADWSQSSDPARQHDGALLCLIRAQMRDARMQYDLRWTQAMKLWQRVLASCSYWEYFTALEARSGHPQVADATTLQEFRRLAFEMVMEGLNAEMERASIKRDAEGFMRGVRVAKSLDLSPELFPIINGEAEECVNL